VPNVLVSSKGAERNGLREAGSIQGFDRNGERECDDGRG